MVYLPSAAEKLRVLAAWVAVWACIFRRLYYWQYHPARYEWLGIPMGARRPLLLASSFALCSTVMFWAVAALSTPVRTAQLNQPKAMRRWAGGAPVHW